MAWAGKLPNITVSNSADTTLDTVRIQDGAKTMWVEIANSAHKVLDVFEIQYQPTSDASFHTVADVPSDFTTSIIYPIKGSTGDMTTLAKSTAGMFALDVQGVYAVKLIAGTAASDTVVDLRWKVR